MGHGPTSLTVDGTAIGTVERIAVHDACEDARTTETNLYVPSINGASDDYYYRVRTGPARWTLVSSSIWRYTFTAIAVVPWIYATATGSRIT